MIGLSGSSEKSVISASHHISTGGGSIIRHASSERAQGLSSEPPPQAVNNIRQIKAAEFLKYEARDIFKFILGLV